jgi:hypothetical protein
MTSRWYFRWRTFPSLRYYYSRQSSVVATLVSRQTNDPAHRRPAASIKTAVCRRASVRGLAAIRAAAAASTLRIVSLHCYEVEVEEVAHRCCSVLNRAALASVVFLYMYDERALETRSNYY